MICCELFSQINNQHQTLNMLLPQVTMFLLFVTFQQSCYVSAKPTATGEVHNAEMPGTGLTLTDFNQQMNETLNKALGDMVANFQRFNVTAMAKQLMQNEPKLTFEGISRLEIPMGNNFEGLKKFTDKIPGLNILNLKLKS